jgi:histone H3/H4
LIPKALFAQCVKEILSNFGRSNIRIQALALVIIQESAEVLLVSEFESK